MGIYNEQVDLSALILTFAPWYTNHDLLKQPWEQGVIVTR